MTQTMYVHVNKLVIKKKSNKKIESLRLTCAVLYIHIQYECVCVCV
jgi:hypothetical protein